VRGILKLGNNRSLNLAKNFRQRQTDAENLLWNQLRDRKLNGVKFRRQHCIGKYIVDFACLKKKLIIEIDGGRHNDSAKKADDEQRTAWLEAEGYNVLRYWNNDVQENIEGVIENISEYLLLKKHPHPDPLPSRERE
jgi:very-short-patch-repair endonuclease